MWQNNGYGNSDHFLNNFNQDGFPPSPFAGASGPPGPQYFQQHPLQPKMMQFEEGNGEDYMNNDFQPQIGLYGKGAFLQNQFANANAQFSPPHFNLPYAMTPKPPPPVTNISSRAAELKAQLLVGRERASSATPPVGMAGQIAKQAGATEGSSLFRGSSRTPVTRAQNSEQELNINELISHYADSKPAADTNVKQKVNNSSPTVSNPQRPSSLPDPLAKSQVPSLGGNTKVTKPNNGKMFTNGFNSKNLGSRHTSNASVSVGSGGEILRDAIPQKALPPIVTKPIIKDEQAPRKPSDEQPFENTQGRGWRDGSPPCRAPPSNPKAQSLRHIHDLRDETDPRQDRMPYPSGYKIDRRPYLPNSKRMSSQRQDVRDQIEDYRRPEIKREQKREDISRSNCEARPLTLAKLLSYDEDLREWLEITGYHNGLYRDKILNRRRAIAALDAQRNVLLAEMEAEECGGVQAVWGLPTRSSAMPPSPIPEKVGDRGEHSLKSGNAVPEPQRDGVASNKRPHSSIQAPAMKEAKERCPVLMIVVRESRKRKVLTIDVPDRVVMILLVVVLLVIAVAVVSVIYHRVGWPTKAGHLLEPDLIKAQMTFIVVIRRMKGKNESDKMVVLVRSSFEVVIEVALLTLTIAIGTVVEVEDVVRLSQGTNAISILIHNCQGPTRPPVRLTWASIIPPKLCAINKRGLSRSW